MMTAKQERFVQEYLIDLNATQAALRAGYSEKTAMVIGSENLKKPEINKAIADALNARRLRTEVTQDRVLEELALVAFADMPDEMVVGRGRRKKPYRPRRRGEKGVDRARRRNRR